MFDRSTRQDSDQAGWSVRSPEGVAGANTQTIHVQLPRGLDEHCDQARVAGAIIASEPEDQFYGARVYRAIDLEGHRWSFEQHVRTVSRVEAEAALGQPIVAADWS